MSLVLLRTTGIPPEKAKFSYAVAKLYSHLNYFRTWNPKVWEIWQLVDEMLKGIFLVDVSAGKILDPQSPHYVWREHCS